MGKGLKVKSKKGDTVVRIKAAENGFVVKKVNEFPGDGKERIKLAKNMKEVKSMVQEFLT